MKQWLYVLLTTLVFVCLNAYFHVNYTKGSDQYWYVEEINSTIVNQNPFAASSGLVFDRNIHDESNYELPMHNSLYFVLIYPFAKFFGIYAGARIAGAIALILSSLLIAKSICIVCGNKKLFAFAYAAVLFFPLHIWMATTILQEIYFLLASAIIVYFQVRKFYSEKQSEYNFYFFCSIAVCLFSILLYPLFMLSALLLGLIEFIYNKNKKHASVNFLIILAIAGVMHVCAGKLFPSYVGIYLIENTLYGHFSFCTMGALTMDLADTFSPIEWIRARTLRFFSGIFSNYFSAVFFIPSAILFIVQPIVAFLKKDTFGIKIFLLSLAFYLPFLAMCFLSQYQARYTLFFMPIASVSFAYVILKIKAPHALKVIFNGAMICLFAAISIVMLEFNQRKILQRENEKNELIEFMQLAGIKPDDKIAIDFNALTDMSHIPWTNKRYCIYPQSKSPEYIDSLIKKFGANALIYSASKKDLFKDYSTEYKIYKITINKTEYEAVIMRDKD